MESALSAIQVRRSTTTGSGRITRGVQAGGLGDRLLGPLARRPAPT